MATSYAGNTGVSIAAYGPAWTVEFQRERRCAFGTIYIESAVKLADIPDGTSNTMLFSERDWSTLKAPNRDNFPDATYWWNSGWWTHTTFVAMAPPNFSRRHPEYLEQGSWWLFNVIASSQHPGGVNVAFTDGSVRFIKGTISSWPEDPAQGGRPLGVRTTVPFTGYGDGKPDVWQYLATRKGGEVISADSY
jgi:prepilin-type processing-associated H-X9-DG protein